MLRAPLFDSLKIFAFKALQSVIFPVLIYLLSRVVQGYYPGNILVCCISTGIGTIASLILIDMIYVRKNVRQRTSYIVFYNTLAIATGSVRMLLMVPTGTLSAEMLTVFIGIASVLILLLTREDIVNGWYYPKEARFEGYIKFSWLNRLLGILFLTALSAAMLMYYGTLLVILPCLIATVFIFFLFNEDDINSLLDENIRYGIFLPGAYMAVSLMYQFGYSKIIFGFMLWQILTAIAALVIVAVIGYLIYLYVEYRKEKKQEALDLIQQQEEKAANNKKKAEEKEAQQANERRVDEETANKISEILGYPQLTWDNIFYIWRNTKSKTADLPRLYPLITEADLKELLSFSKLKKQLYWDQGLVDALKIINESVSKVTDDALLKKFISQQKDFLVFIAEFADFKGYPRLLETVSDDTGDVLYLLPDDSKRLFLTEITRG